MTLPNLPEVPPNPTTQQLAQVVGALVQELSYLLSGFLSSSNAREFGGWSVGNTELQSKDKTVGMSTAKTGADDIRFFAGDVITGSPKFKVTESGIASMEGAIISSSSSAERVVLDSNGLHSYDEFGIERVTLADTPDQSTKALYFWDAAGPSGSNLGFLTYGTAFIDGSNRTGLFITGTGGSILGALFLSNNGIVELVTDAAAPTGFRAVDGTRPQINSGGGWVNIATVPEVNAKQNAFTGINGTVYVASSSGGPTTTAITFTNGVRTS